MVRETATIALSALRSNRLRTSLTVLSIMLGTMAIVFLISLADSGLQTLARGIEEIGGARLIFIFSKKPERAQEKASVRPIGFTKRDREQLTHGIAGIAMASVYSTLDSVEVTSDAGLSMAPDVVAADENFLSAFALRLERGRALSSEDRIHQAPVCVVGDEVASGVWKKEDPIGRMLSLRGVGRCQVIGVLANNERVGIGFGFNWRKLIVAPLEWVEGMNSQASSNLHFLIRANNASENEMIKRTLNARLEQWHSGIDDFTLLDLGRAMEKFERIFAIMRVIVGLIASIALFIGGIGIMNMMLVAVTERTREIGLRRALGAAQSTIRQQFITEAALVSTVGGAVGAGVGIALALASGVIGRAVYPRWIGVVSWQAAGMAVFLSSLVGLVFGTWPAARASRLDPVEALRR